MKKNTNVKIWGEHVNLKQFLLGLLISVFILIISLLLTDLIMSNSNKSLDAINNIKLIVGLISVLISFVINLIMIKPKRDIIVKGSTNNDN